MSGQEILGLATMIGMLAGFYIKRKTGWNTKLIPAVQILVMGIKNWAVAAGVWDESATVMGHLELTDSTYALAAFWDLQWVRFIIHTIVDAALPIGLYSGTKNLVEARAPKKRK